MPQLQWAVYGVIDRGLTQQKTKVSAAQSSYFSKTSYMQKATNESFSVFSYFRVVINAVMKLFFKTAKLIFSKISVDWCFTGQSVNNALSLMVVGPPDKNDVWQKKL